jgi:phosphatidate cytidylyltransferase
MTKIRLLAALVMTPIAIAAILLLPTPWMVALATVVMLAGLLEWFDLAEIDDTLARNVLLIAHLGVMVAIVWASRWREGYTLVLYQVAAIVGIVWWLVALFWLRHNRFGSDHQSFARAFKLAAGALAVIPAWCALAWIHAEQPAGHRWLLAALVVVWAADTGAYFTGRKLGRRKLAPTVSPNKTVEGLAGGVVAGIAAGIGFGLIAGADAGDLPKVAIVSFATVLFSVIGDLFESMLKRHVGVKDSGRLIPGHGGILDRIDGVLAALPVFAVGKALLGF